MLEMLIKYRTYFRDLKPYSLSPSLKQNCFKNELLQNTKILIEDISISNLTGGFIAAVNLITADNLICVM